MISGGTNGAWLYAAWFAGLLVLLILASFGLVALTALLAIAIANLPLILAYLSSWALFWTPITMWAAYECVFNILPATPPDIITAVCMLILVIAGNRTR